MSLVFCAKSKRAYRKKSRGEENQKEGQYVLDDLHRDILHENPKKCKNLTKNAIFFKKNGECLIYRPRRSKNDPNFPVVLERVLGKVLTPEKYFLSIDKDNLPMKVRLLQKSP